MQGLHVIEAKADPKSDYKIDWDNIGIRLIQIAQDGDCWVLDMQKMRAYPEELKRILTSQEIAKAGVGMVKDIAAIWEDFRTEMANVVDVGMMGKLFLCKVHSKTGYDNLSMETCAEEILGYKMDKSVRVSNWRSHVLTDRQVEYASLDAVASLRLHEVLSDGLQRKAEALNTPIPPSWYTFNSRFGDRMKTNRNFWGEEVAWTTKDCTWFSGGKFQGYP
ncbi:ribonuclease H-like domain-containing protein [Mycena galericulata]|nr:ribonuclease H-like domain-containing protein [Mycena galericulata]